MLNTILARFRSPPSASASSTFKVGHMSKIAWRQVLAWALAAFFVAGSLSNIFAPRSIIEEYVRWGYPHWFHFVTGTLELTTAVLLARAPTRLWGAALGGTRVRHDSQHPVLINLSNCANQGISRSLVGV